MNATDANHDQAENWSGTEGDHWVQNAQRHDDMLVPFADQIAAVAQLRNGERVLDIGCGCGLTTVRSGGAVGATGAVLGVDLSPQMLEVATARAETADVGEWTRFRAADAQTDDLGTDQWDVVLSRFGVMFFDDPVAAYTNIASAVRPGGRLVFCCWQPLDNNDWMLVPGLAVAQHVELPQRAFGDAPGPFSMGDPDRVRTILGAAGFDQVNVDPFLCSVLLAGGGSIDDTITYMTTSGLGRALLENAPEREAAAAIEAVRQTLAPLHDGDGIRLGAAAWMITAVLPPTQPAELILP